MVVVGGGATGLGCAIDAAARGYRTLLLEQHDFGKGTSSRSTKLVHGGVRYLRQGNVALVVQALRERSLLLNNAPHLVRKTPLVVPLYKRWEGPFYGVGFKVYDLLAGRAGFGRSRRLSVEETVECLPTIEQQGLRGGVRYFDGQFDDARLAVNMAQTAVEQGAAALNYVEVVGLIKDGERVAGVQARDAESGEAFSIGARVVVNATGVWADRLRQIDAPDAPPMITPSQGAHLVLPRSFLGGDHALMVPRTDDGRVLFAIPWYDVVVIGTTDSSVREAPLEPVPLDREVDFLLEHAARYLTRKPSVDDVLSAFAGLRPLVSDPAARGTASLKRDHTLHVASSGLVTITGGKWTTYRQMAEDAVGRAAAVARLPVRACRTRAIPIHGAHPNASSFGDLASYGADAPAVRELIDSDPAFARRLDPEHPFVAGQVVWAARHEMARTVEDVLARRVRLLDLDAAAAVRAAPAVAAVLARELDRPEGWTGRQLEAFGAVARQRLLTPGGTAPPPKH